MMRKFDRYTVLEVLRESAYGATYLVEHESLLCRRIIKCVKKIHPDYRSLLREARILQRIRCESIPVVYDVEEREDEFILVEEYIEGESMKNFLKRKKSLSESDLIDYSMQLCDLLIYIHDPEHKVLHLDLKPDNLLISDEKMKLIDFGSAICQFENESGYIASGTPCFAAPELFENGKMSEETDIYSMGKVFEYMLLYAKLSPKGYNEIIKMCVRASEKRFANALEVKEALKALNTGRVKCYEGGRWFSVTGIPTDYHSTYFAYLLAKALAKHGTVLFIDCNPKRNSESLERKAENETKEGFVYETEGITVAKRVLAGDVKGWRNRGYNFVVVDFGSALPDTAEVPFEESFLVGSFVPWTIRFFVEYVSRTVRSGNPHIVITEGNMRVPKGLSDHCLVSGPITKSSAKNVTCCILKKILKRKKLHVAKK